MALRKGKSCDKMKYVSVEAFKEIQDSVCVAQRRSDLSEERVLLFLKMAPGSEFTNELAVSMKKCIRSELSARHVPEVILPIEDIPVSRVHICKSSSIHEYLFLQYSLGIFQKHKHCKYVPFPNNHNNLTYHGSLAL